MEKTARAELIAALETDKFSGFVDGDRAILESASDERLEKFRAAADAARSAANEHDRLATEHRNVGARLTVAMERIKAAEQPMTEEEFLAKAPEKFKQTLQAAQAIEEATKASLISALEGRGVLGKEELEKRTIPELQTLADYARVSVPDFSGKGAPRAASAGEKTSYAPPDGYAEPLKAIRTAQSKAVN